MPTSPIVVGSSFYLNVGNNGSGVKDEYLRQTRRWTEAVKAAGYRPFLELKHLGLVTRERLDELKSAVDLFTLHVQYLERPGKSNTTLNLVDPSDRAAIETDPQTANAFDLIRPALVSFHCGFSAVEIGTAPPGDHNYALTPVLSREETFSRINDSLDTVISYFRRKGYANRILIENLDYTSGGGLGCGSAYEHVCEKDFILELLAKPEIGSLLDIAHSLISANNLIRGYTPQHLARALYNSGKLAQIHLNAPQREDGDVFDMHLPFYTDEDVVNTLRTILRMHKNDTDRKDPLFITIEPSASVCESDPEEAVYKQGCELLKLLKAVYG
ncbi:MAG: DUF692 family multinuclear iron-containing protein [Candidatus Margulisiibacteriota bacterium]